MFENAQRLLAFESRRLRSNAAEIRRAAGNDAMMKAEAGQMERDAVELDRAVMALVGKREGGT